MPWGGGTWPSLTGQGPRDEPVSSTRGAGPHAIRHRRSEEDVPRRSACAGMAWAAAHCPGGEGTPRAPRRTAADARRGRRRERTQRQYWRLRHPNPEISAPARRPAVPSSRCRDDDRRLPNRRPLRPAFSQPTTALVQRTGAGSGDDLGSKTGWASSPRRRPRTSNRPPPSRRGSSHLMTALDQRTGGTRTARRSPRARP